MLDLPDGISGLLIYFSTSIWIEEKIFQKVFSHELYLSHTTVLLDMTTSIAWIIIVVSIVSNIFLLWRKRGKFISILIA